MKRFLIAPVLAMLGAAPAMAQVTPNPVVPRACDITTVTTGGTAVTALTGPTNGFLLENPSGATEALTYDLVGTASTTQSGASLGLAAGASVLFAAPLAAGVNLSVNAATSAHAFSCMRW